MSIFYKNNSETTKEERIQQFKGIMYKQFSNICAADSVHDNIEYVNEYLKQQEEKQND